MAILARFFRLGFASFAFGSLPLLFSPGTALALEAREQAEAVLMPFLDVLASPPAGEARAFRVQGRLESLNAQPSSPQPGQPAAAPQPFDFALQPPGRMRLSFPSAGVQITACRNGQRAWVAPAAAVRPLLAQLASSQKQRSLQFPPLELPFSGRQLALLPALLEVQDKGSSPLDGSPCRILDVRMQPEIGSLMPAEAKGWALRLWVNPAGRPARAGIQGPGTSAVLRFDSVHFSAQLPAALWDVPADSASLTPAEFDALIAQLLQNSKQR